MSEQILSGEAYLITKSENLAYLTGFDGEGFVLLMRNKRFVCTDRRYLLLAKRVAPKDFIVVDRGDKIMKEFSRRELKQIRTVKFEEESVTVAALRRWKKVLTGKKWAHGDRYVERLRLVKNKKEISLLRKAGALGDLVLARTLKSVRPGKTELEIKRMILRHIADSGADGPSFDPIVAFGENSAVPHHYPTERKLRKDDVVLIDMGVKYRGYCSDMSRTFLVGDVRPELKGMFQLTREAQKEAACAVRAGVRIRYLDEIARSVMGDEAKHFTHSLGHGVGLEVHEDPGVTGKNDLLLMEGMVITIEPGIYKEGIGGIRIEDTLLVTKKGAVNLTRFPKSPLLPCSDRPHAPKKKLTRTKSRTFKKKRPSQSATRKKSRIKKS